MEGSATFVDDWTSTGQATLTYGKKISEYGKYIIMEVLIYYAHNKKVDDPAGAVFREAADMILADSSLSISELWSKFTQHLSSHSAEGVMAHAMSVYGKRHTSLLMRTFYTFGKIKPLATTSSWFNNYQLNGICNGINNVVWDDSTCPSCYAVRRKPSDINQAVNCYDYKRICTYLVGRLRMFIVRNSFYQSNAEDGVSYKLTEPKTSAEGKMMSYSEICDRCYQFYPFYWAGAHACDFSLFPNLAITIDEVRSFNMRYPSAIVGWILNTATYASRMGGRHWLAFMTKHTNAYVLDSSGKVLTNFRDNGVFRDKIARLGYGLNYGMSSLQEDNFSCGMFSVLSLYLMLCNDCKIEETTKQIGKNGTALMTGKSITSFTQVLAGFNPR